MTSDQDHSAGVAAEAPIPAAPSPDPPPVHLSFAGPLNENSIGRFAQQLPGLTQGFPPDAVVHLAFQSSGGTVGDAVWLYNFMRHFPRRIVAYNIGSVASAGVTAYLGAHRRIVNRHGLFMIHRSTVDRAGISVSNLKVAAEYLEREDRRTEAILREAVPKIPAAVFDKMQTQDVWFNADEAVATGLADDVGDFAPPVGSKIFYI